MDLDITTPTKLPDELIDAGVSQHLATLSETNRGVRDPVITPFAFSMKLAGFTCVTTHGGCSVLRECPTCRGKYSTRYRKRGREFWACPHCRWVTPIVESA